MPEQGTLGVMQLWFAKKKGVPVKWTEVRGKPVDQWDPNCPFHQLHDLKRVDVSQLHAEEVATLVPEAGEDWEFAVKFLLDS